MAPIDEQSPEYVAMQQLFQRDVNRLYDAADRNTRKRGLTKLIDELPWDDKKKDQRSALRLLITNLIITPSLALIADPTEKVRELALKLINLCIKELKLKGDLVSTIVNSLCARIGGGSGLSDQSGFAEVSEELRLVVIQTLGALLTKFRGREQEEPVVVPSAMADVLLGTFTRILQDAFPAIKREGAELLCALCSTPTPFTTAMIPAASVRLHYKPLLTKALVPNITHQHNKVRSVTLRAVSHVVAALDCVIEDFETVIAETLGPLLTRSIMNDKNPSVRRELCNFCSTVLGAFYRGNASTHSGLMGLDADAAGTNKLLVGNTTIVAILLILCGDQSPEVKEAAREHILLVALAWGCTPAPSAAGGTKMAIEGAEEDNAELVCRHAGATGRAGTSSMEDAAASISDELAIANFLCNYRSKGVSDISTTWFPRFYRTLVAVVLDGVNGWTMTSRMQYSRGLQHLFRYTIITPTDPVLCREYQLLATALFSSAAITQEGRTSSYVAEAPTRFAAGLLAYDVVTTLGVALRSDESELRLVAQACGDELGLACGRQHTGAEDRNMVTVFAELLIPLIAGVVPGGDTASQRCNAIRTATYLLQGFASAGPDASSVSAGLVADVLVPMSGVEMYAFKETYVNESILIFLRMVIAKYPTVCTEGIVVRERILLCFVCLLGVHSSGGPPRAPPAAPVDENMSLGSVNTSSMHYNTTSTGAGVSVIYEASYRELLNYCGLCGGDQPPVNPAAGSGDSGNIAAVEAGMGPYYAYFLGCLITGKHVPDLSVSQSKGAARLLSSEQKLVGLSRVCSPSNRTDDGEVALDVFMLQPHLKNAFESLVRVAPGLAWSYHSTLVPVMILHTEPPVAPEPMPPIPPGATLEEREALKPKETPEQVMRGYAACRGEDLTSEATKRARDESHLQTRLDLIGLLEDMLRYGAVNWECSAHINAAAEEVLTRILLPNLVWKVRSCRVLRFPLL